jgi:arylsulfatase
MKWHSKEGGTRVPCIVRYPGKVPADQDTEELISAIDLYPTLAHACGIDIQLPEDAQQMDGVNAWGIMIDIIFNRPRTELLYWHGKGQATALRQGDWKLFFNAGDKGDPDLSEGPLLFDLAKDPKETTDLASQFPERTEAMLARAKELLQDVYNNQLPIGTWPGVEPTEAPLKAEEVWGPWIK